MLKGGEKVEQYDANMLLMSQTHELSAVKSCGFKNKKAGTNDFAKMFNKSLQEKQGESAIQGQAGSGSDLSKRKHIKSEDYLSHNNDNVEKAKTKEKSADETKNVEDLAVALPAVEQEMTPDQLIEIANNMVQTLNAAGFTEESEKLLQSIQDTMMTNHKVIDLEVWIKGIAGAEEKLQQMVQVVLEENLNSSKPNGDGRGIQLIDSEEQLAAIHADESGKLKAKTTHVKAAIKNGIDTKNDQSLLEKSQVINQLKNLSKKPGIHDNTKNMNEQTKIVLPGLSVEDQEKAALQPSHQSTMSNMMEGSPKDVLFKPIMEMGNEAAVMETGESSSSENVMEQIVSKASLMSKEGLHEMKIQLKPEYLGELSMKVALENGTLTAKFFVQNHQVKEAIESQMIQLRHHFEEQGLKVQNVQVFVGQDHDLQQQSFGSHSFHQQHSKQQFYFSNGYHEEEGITWEDEVVNQQLIAPTGMSESVDYRV